MAQRHSKQPDIDHFTQTWRLPLTRVLLMVAMGISTYLLYVSLSGGAVAGCGPESGCDRVLKSPWAYWLGIPVSAFALLVYATLMGITFPLKSGTPERRRRLWQAAFTLALTMLGAAAWFIGLMIFAVKGICPFCMVAHASGITVALLLVRNAPIKPVPEHPWQREKQLYLPPAQAKKLAAMAVAGIAVLALGQCLFKKQMNVVQTLPELAGQPRVDTNRQANSLQAPATNSARTTGTLATAGTTGPAKATSAPPSQAIPAPPPTAGMATTTASTNRAPRWITSHNGLFMYNLNELPILGSPAGTNTVISLFDYTCHHCHTMHGHILEALGQISNQVTFVSLPMPLDAECNPAVYRTHRTASNACNYARLGLAVWRAAPEQLAKFDEFMFAKYPQPPLAEANNYAANLVGADRLARSLMDPWVTNQIHKDVSIYQTNLVLLHNGSMPQLIRGGKVSAGALNNAQELIQFTTSQ